MTHFLMLTAGAATLTFVGVAIARRLARAIDHADARR